jgi:anti-anti-sigma factor
VADPGVVGVRIGAEADGTPVVELSGELDLAGRVELEEALVGLATGAERIVVDLADVTFIDSAGIAALLAAHVAGARVVVRNARPRVAATIDLVGIRGILEVEDAGA